MIKNGLKGNKSQLVLSAEIFKSTSSIEKHPDFDEIISMIQRSDLQPAISSDKTF